MALSTILVVAAIATVLVVALGWGDWWRRRDQSVTVFVDDAVEGRFPPVCAITGEPADKMIRLEQPLRPVEPLWLLLLLLGPLGLVALIVVMATRGGSDTVTAVVPVTSASFDRYRTAVRRRRVGLALAVVPAAVVALAASASQLRLDPFAGPVLGAAVVAVVAFGLLLAMAAHTDVLGESLRITLDASRRWMTLRGVHPRFRDAVHETSVHRTN